MSSSVDDSAAPRRPVASIPPSGGDAPAPAVRSGATPVVFGEVLFDRFPDGSRVLGGAPFNVAWHLCGFGDDPVLLSAVGDDEEGRAVRGELASWGLSTEGLRTRSDAATGRVDVAHHDDGGPTYDIPEGQAWDRLTPDQVDVEALRRSAGLLYHGTLALRSEPSRRALRDLVDQLSCPVFLDLNLRDPWWNDDLVDRSLAGATWAKVNQRELALALGRDAAELARGDACVEAAAALRKRHALSWVAVTRGTEGSLLVTASGDVFQAPVHEVADVVDTVGAGDAFSACLCHGILHGWEHEELLPRASAFAAEACRFEGATATDLAVYEGHLRKWADVLLTGGGHRADGASEGLYVLSLSIHGLLRGSDIELGRDPDTGGQISYVVDQARALARHARVGRVEVLTRLVEDQRVDGGYANPREAISEGADIVRLPFGPRRYLRKESLWPHLDGLLDELVRHVRKVGRPPDVILGHYADAGYVGAQLGKLLGVPFVFTGHSLGRLKRERLEADGRDPEVIERRYHLNDRIEAEERALETADLVVASTPQEVEDQYTRYDHHVSDRVAVIPPGVDLERFSPPSRFWTPPAVIDEINRFLRRPDRPWILAIARPDERKNFDGLITAYAVTPGLREIANLVLVAGTRDDIAHMPPAPRRVLRSILAGVDRHDLYGSVAYPKTHDPSDVPELYRMAARTRGVFVNPALTEPFGLTLIEAAASGVPVVATDDGGPRSIIEVCRNGVLADPLDSEAFGEAIYGALEDRAAWGRWAKRGVARVHDHFSWSSHARHLVETVEEVLSGQRPAPPVRPPPARLPHVGHLVVVNLDALTAAPGRHPSSSPPDVERAFRRVAERIAALPGAAGVVVFTSRTLSDALEILARYDVLAPDLFVTASGTEIHYGPHRVKDRSWERQIRYRWEPEDVRAALTPDTGLRMEAAAARDTAYRLTCRVSTDDTDSVRRTRRTLRRAGVRATVVPTGPGRLDVVPVRASPTLAVRFVCYKWNVPMERVRVLPRADHDDGDDTATRALREALEHSSSLSTT